MFTDICLKVFSLFYKYKVKSLYDFWKTYKSKEDIDNLDIDTASAKEFLHDKNYNLICAFDDDFPEIPANVRLSEKPVLFAYKGDISLIKNDKNNVAVIGVLNPTEDIILRETTIVKQLTDNKLNIVSGLARGCDTVAHTTCIKNDGKTIAILPTTFENLYPKENATLVDKIIANGGLVLTEYIVEPQNRFEQTKRFVERDRLQTMFSKEIILIASFTQGNGDSGSRHAMNKAKEYNKNRFVMYNEKTDKSKEIFVLNEQEICSGAKILTQASIKDLI